MPLMKDRLFFKDLLRLEPEDVIVVSWFESETGTRFAPARRIESLREDVVKFNVYKIDRTIEEIWLREKDDRSMANSASNQEEYKTYIPAMEEIASCDRWIKACGEE